VGKKLTLARTKTGINLDRQISNKMSSSNLGDFQVESEESLELKKLIKK